MNRFSQRTSFTFLFFVLLGIVAPEISKAQNQRHITAEVDFRKSAQTIEGFGASDAWTCQFAGLWPDVEKNKMADLLFSTKTNDAGNPLGIGLNFWRFAIGGGSAEQGKASGIRDEWRRQQSFLNLSKTYNEEAMPGQVWFMNAAKTRGVKHFLGFVNSPHVNFTLNNKAFSGDGKTNLDFSKADDFALDLVNTIKILKKKTGVELEYLSPVNEPQWKWNEGNQEGCPYTNQELAVLIKKLSATLNKTQLKTKIQIAEAGQLNYLTNHPDTAKSRQVEYFFSPASRGYLGDLKNVDRSISGHSYFTTSPEQKSIEIRKAVKEEVAKYDRLRFWMSEYCVLGDSLLKGEGRDLGMTTALFIAKLIHHDLTYANASSWQWWLAISTGDYKDGLVYMDKSKTGGKVYDSKTLWAFGNYSRFIPQGSVRIEMKLSDEKDFYVSAYLKDHKLITVAVNNSDDTIDLDLAGIDQKQKNVTIYTTAAGKNLERSVTVAGAFKLPAKSVTTIIANKEK
ncbi:xylanase [Pedobacter petrophilus]|uniref:Xylanase n=1 Tax=Pedobacter petrophilus TaxID=1908241 RepID=A0A7K0G472_9SPHI|nr:glycoside hydrolase family 30 protein [Pedobacter petrophilus]MRX77776.1 xylanase [Pedobacter petrophilus]